ncbi:MAG: substrate-binding domain-containing protein [Fusobacteriaceae bacterium]|nr:substrate-binding domain-containing protein [Fusobacteriaceae bacterium]
MHILLIVKIILTAASAYFSWITARLVWRYFAPEKIYDNPLLPVAFLLIFLVLFLIITILWLKRFRRYAVKILGIVAIFVVGARFGVEIYEEREDSITVREGIPDISAYLPFRDDGKIARLPFPSSFRIPDNPPILDGAETLFPVYAAFVNAVYPPTIPPLNEEGGPFTFHGADEGYRALAEGKIDLFFGYYLGNFMRKFESPEQSIDFTFHMMGKDALVFFVHKNNPVENLTSEEIRKIYAGEIKNWREVGGEDREIIAYQRNPQQESQIFMQEFMGTVPLAAPPKKKLHRQANPEKGIRGGVVEAAADYRNSPGAIGYALRFYLLEAVKDYDVKLLSVDGIPPTLENIKSGQYSQLIPLYAVRRWDNANPNVDPFVEWILFEEGQYLIERSGYAPVN